MTAAIVLNLIAGNEINLTSKNINIASNCFNVDKDGKITLIDTGIESGVLNIINSNFNSSIRSYGAHFKGPTGYVGIDADFAYSGGTIKVAPSETETSNYTLIQDGKVSAVTVTQRSLERIKKNIKKTDINALELIKNSDIYEYNLKSEEDTDKKHIGFVIGNNYKTPNEVIEKTGEGIDTYSMSSIMWKAIQEQQEQIENQNNLIQSLIERIEKLEAK